MEVLAPQLLSFLRYSHFKFHKKWRRGGATSNLAPRRQMLKSTTQTSLGSRMRSIQDMIKIFFASVKTSLRVYSTRKVCHANTYWRLYEFLCQFSTTKFKRVVDYVLERTGRKSQKICETSSKSRKSAIILTFYGLT